MINIFKRKVNQAKHPLTPKEPTHRIWTIYDEIQDFVICNRNAILLVLIAVMILTIIFMMGYAAGTGHIHFLSTEANKYEHMNQIVTNGGATCLFFKKWQI